MTRTDLSKYGVFLLRHEYAAVMRISDTTLKRQLATGTCEVQPALCQPYRWRVRDVQAHIDAMDLPADRRLKARFAMVRARPMPKRRRRAA
jgi:hypothetical protein